MLRRKDNAMKGEGNTKPKRVRNSSDIVKEPKIHIIEPSPVIDKREEAEIEKLLARYEKLTQPTFLQRKAINIKKRVPNNVKELVEKPIAALSEAELIKQAMEYVATGFCKLEEITANITIDLNDAIARINKGIEKYEVQSFEEITYVRAYDLAKAVNNYKNSHILAAAAEGAATGALGFAGLVPNVVASMFLYFRAVQSVAMMYGYDVKNDAAEMEIASSVLTNAFNPTQATGSSELTATIGKFMTLAETTAVKHAAKHTWAEMAEMGGIPLLITQIRALANAAAKKALEKAGKEGLEKSVFRSILAQLGKHLGKRSLRILVPLIGGAIGACFDTAQMYKIVNYADIFYCKRFIEEKETRIYYMSHPDEPVDFNKIVDVESIVIDDLDSEK